MKNKVWIASGLAVSILTSTLTATAADNNFVDFRNDTTGKRNAPNATPWGTWSKTIYCPAGSYVAGYMMKVEGNQKKGDDTALNAVSLWCYNRDGRMVGGLQPHQGIWGRWGSQAAVCPQGSYATEFSLKVEPPQGRGDDTGANSVKFKCSNGAVMEVPGGGAWGTWSNWVIDTGFLNSAICGVRAKFEGDQGKGDDTALNDLEFTWCRL
jgi:hypothetical protein